MKNLTQLAKLQKQLIDKYQEKEVNVNLQNNAYLTISFINSPLNQQDDATRAARAEDVAKFVVKNFPPIRQIQQIWIVFLKSESRFIIFHYSQALGAFSFNNRGELLRRPNVPNVAPDSEDPLNPSVKFDPRRNETDIGLERVQLDRDPDHGIAMVPYYTAKGDARGPVRSAAAPSSVTLDFASYAEQPIFSGDSRLEIICDGKTQFAGNARLLQPQESGTAAGHAQFLTVEIPFSDFRRMGEAHKTTVRLNAKQFDLNSDAIAALKRMASFVAPGAASE
ncbi:MAG TPA: hypothetical protein VE863_22560 [Pyrinomonadaceae bacterium]|nr:hypothetical protein [Pyrinomonadaceae bacterium]